VTVKASVKVPATTANLGPGFDALGLALDLWNQVEFTPREDSRVVVDIQGEGAGRLPTDHRNTIAAAALRVFERVGEVPPGLEIHCLNRIPLGSGMGSSAAAVLTGLLGGNALLGNPLSQDEILLMAVAAEGHPDNVAPALLGGLVVSITDLGKTIAHKLTPRAERKPFFITLVLPEFDFSTRQARALIPDQVRLEDAVFNLSHAALACEALCTGDLDLLSLAMEDRLHQPYRLPLIPGAPEAMQAAKDAGAAAVALSGAGPSLAAFSKSEDPAIGAAMHNAFAAAGLRTRVFHLQPSQQGAQVSLAQQET
jgi:homoserine kinase